MSTETNMILEGLLTTTAADGSVHLAPMGPMVDELLDTFVLRPFQTSTSYQNLKRTGGGVFHVTDDVEMLARAAVGELRAAPPTQPCSAVNGFILSGACRWFALKVEELDDRAERTTIRCRAVECGELRPFFGLNRAKHAVVEGSILATRLHLLPHDEIAQQFVALRPLVDKTGGEAERRAFAFLEDYMRRGGVPLPPAGEAK
jgi:uncharacterized protein